MAPKLSTALEVVGLLLIVAAAATLSVGWALLAAGVACVALGVAGER